MSVRVVCLQQSFGIGQNTGMFVADLRCFEKQSLELLFWPCFVSIDADMAVASWLLTFVSVTKPLYRHAGSFKCKP